MKYELEIPKSVGRNNSNFISNHSKYKQSKESKDDQTAIKKKKSLHEILINLKIEIH